MNSELLAEIHAKSFITPRPWSASEFDELLIKDSIFLISEKRSFLLGMLTRFEAEILTIAVDPINRRIGIAEKLLNEFETLCLNENVEKIILEVAKNNAPALMLYKKCGYKIKGERNNYYTSPEGKKITAIVMSKLI
ncbi:GNAT family N-acetyltransferase [Amylibacter sp.]|nr:GNAT family N-acetyltransferase [Amylibacter sp.]